MTLNPVLSLSNMRDIHTLCQHYLQIIYHDIGALSHENPNKINPATETQGEILYPSITKLLSVITLTADDVFIDLGSGTGKITAQVFLMSPVKEAWGIEIVPELHQYAVRASERIQREFLGFFMHGRKLNLLQGSFFDIPFRTATVALINATCFSQMILHRLSKIINETPSIHTVFSLRPLTALTRLVFKKTIRIECSWDSALCYVYGENSSNTR